MKKVGRLDAKVAVITGAADGIGRATSVLFAREGARLVLADLNEEGLEESLSQVKKEGGEGIVRVTDVSVEQEVGELIGLALETWAGVDILCNNAGIVGELADLEAQEADEWQRVLEVNLLSAFSVPSAWQVT